MISYHFIFVFNAGFWKAISWCLIHCLDHLRVLHGSSQHIFFIQDLCSFKSCVLSVKTAKQLTSEPGPPSDSEASHSRSRMTGTAIPVISVTSPPLPADGCYYSYWFVKQRVNQSRVQHCVRENSFLFLIFVHTHITHTHMLQLSGVSWCGSSVSFNEDWRANVEKMEHVWAPSVSCPLPSSSFLKHLGRGGDWSVPRAKNGASPPSLPLASGS